MVCDRAEIAAAEAPAVVGYGETDLLYRGNSAVLFVHRVIGSLIRKSVHPVKLLALERERGWIDRKHTVVVILHKRASVYRVVIRILLGKRRRIRCL